MRSTSSALRAPLAGFTASRRTPHRGEGSDGHHGRSAGPPATTRHLCTAAIEAANPGDVIVVEQRTGLDAACWGGNLALGAHVRGVAGVIVEGPARDIDDCRKFDFPVFAREHTARTARGRILEVADE